MNTEQQLVMLEQLVESYVQEQQFVADLRAYLKHMLKEMRK